MPRPAIIVALAPPDLDPVREELIGAGFDVLSVATAVELEAILQARRDVGVAIIDGETDLDRSLELYSLLHEGDHAVPALMIVAGQAFERLATQPSNDAATEYFTRPYTVDSLRWRVEAMLIRSQTFDDGSGPILEANVLASHGLAQRAMIVAVFNPKGGVGKTTVATNLAMALQTRRGQKVLLIDADTTSGHIATSLGIEQSASVADAWEEDDALPHGLAGVASEHPSGLRVAVLTSNPLQLERITPQRLADHLSGSRLGFDVLLIDLHPDYGELNRAIFERADRILVPVTPDVPALRAAIQFVEIAGELGIRDRLALIVNRANSGVSVGDMERTTGMGAFGTIHSGGLRFVRAANEGLTVIEKYPRDRVTEDFLELADRLLGREPQRRAVSRGILGFLGRQREAPARA